MSFRTHARAQAQACVEFDAPFMARLLTLLADGLRPVGPVAARLLDWPAPQLGPDAVALRLAAALHYLVLTGQAPVLARLYAAHEKTPDAQLWHALDATLRHRAPAILEALDRPPQTNECSLAAVYIAAAHWLSAAFRLPLVLSELGSASGLNLIWDAYALEIDGQRFGKPDTTLCLHPAWRGPLPPAAQPVIRSRAGIDLNPLDPLKDQARILSYIWAGQSDRLERARAALAIAATRPLDILRGNAVDWLEMRLARPVPQAVHLVCHTLIWQYLTEAEQVRVTAALARAGGRVRGDEPLAHLFLEPDGKGPGGAIILKLWPGNDRIMLGRADLHGRWIDWQAPALG
ncbi:MAG: DUF2332 domain-containing protein [Roseinatronobacter sp.]